MHSRNDTLTGVWLNYRCFLALKGHWDEAREAEREENHPSFQKKKINQCSRRIWKYVDGWRLWRGPLTIATASQRQNEENHKTHCAANLQRTFRDSSKLLNLVTSQALHNRSQISYRHTQDIQMLVNVKGPTCFCSWELSPFESSVWCAKLALENIYHRY